MKTKLSRAMLSVLLLLLPAAALADSISPSSYSATLAVGESATVNKTVTVSAGTPTSAKVDVFFLADTTGSMGGVISAVKTNAAAILSATAGLGDVAFGVGEYKDLGDTYAYRLNTAITTSAASAQAGLNLWAASGGGDTPEANLYALQRVAEDAGTGWRAGSTRIMVWFGDAIGHDPRLGSTEASATSALQAKGIIVQAINSGNLDGTGQATRISAATGGQLFALAGSGTGVADVIKDAIEASFASYSNVSLDVSEVPAGVGVSVNPVDYSGAFSRETERSFSFDVTFTGVTPGDYSFNIYALVDKGRVATESDRIRVGEGEVAVPEPSTLLLFGLGLLGLTGIRRKFKI
ncbi:MAG: VWA domain-containing protein [Desulfobacterales bacterium]|jgi:hypothetical protein|nr:VWA domain-containing protein [Desulfobacterales bacterium]